MLSLEDLIELGDVDELLREIDRRCERRDWAGVLELRDRCRRAVERGKHLWGAAGHAEYRLALEGTGFYAASVLDSDPGPLVLGPLPEVAASTHKWSELTEHLPQGPLRGLTAYECVARGEDLSSKEDLLEHERAFGLPLTVLPWEPVYSLAEYSAAEAKFPSPSLTRQRAAEVPTLSARLVRLDEELLLLRDVFNSWTSQSNGKVKIAGVDVGDSDDGGLQAIAAVGGSGQLANVISVKDAVAELAWAGANGGAHGKRAGAAAGRTKAWWAISGALGLIEEGELPDPEDLADGIEDLECWTWGDPGHNEGWHVRLALHDWCGGTAYAIEAQDSA